MARRGRRAQEESLKHLRIFENPRRSNDFHTEATRSPNRDRNELLRSSLTYRDNDHVRAWRNDRGSTGRACTARASNRRTGDRGKHADHPGVDVDHGVHREPGVLRKGTERRGADT